MAQQRYRFRFHHALFSLLFLEVAANLFGMIPSFLVMTEGEAQVEKSALVAPGVTEIKQKPLYHQTNRTLHFIPSQYLGKLDYFSATWIQPLSTFLKLQTNKIHTVEMGVFRVWTENRHNMRMTLNWLDFSVEHLSKYWKNAQVFQDAVSYNFITKRLERYVKTADISTRSDASLHETIALVAFQPYNNGRMPQEARHLTVASLAATLASMMQAGFGRILVVGYESGDESYAHDAFRMLYNRASNTQTSDNNVRIANTEVAYVNVTLEEVTSIKTPINRVKGALVGLQKALSGSMTIDRQEEWLGTTHSQSYWRYVYLTEPDTVLQVQQAVLPQIRAALDNGLILAPHRLQPLPHESDLKGMRNPDKYLPATGKFEHVVELNPLDDGDACCDDLSGKTRPFENFPRCNSFWWQCGFNARRDHSRLEPYQLLRLRQTGTGITNLAGTEHGRRCTPRVNGVCSLTPSPPLA